MTGARFLRLPVVAVVLICVVAPAWAGRRATELKKREETVARWNETLVTTDKDLKGGRYADAIEKCTRLAREMVDTMGPGSDAMYTLAAVTAMRAIAEVGSGNRRDGLWHWRVACALFSKYTHSDLSVYGEPGRWLMRQPAVEDRGSDVHRLSATNQSPVSAPVLTRKVDPRYPEGLRLGRVEALVIVECVVGKDGIPREPVVLTKGIEAAMIYEALEAVRQWRFEPGKIDGKPCDVVFNLTIHYVLRK